jgi:hypothetical protein
MGYAVDPEVFQTRGSRMLGKIGGLTLIADDNRIETETERPPSLSWGLGLERRPMRNGLILK